MTDVPIGDVAAQWTEVNAAVGGVLVRIREAFLTVRALLRYVCD